MRRCVDLVELLAAAAVGTARAALISADLRGLDREALAQLAASGIAVVGLAADEAGERLLHQLGAGFVVARRQRRPRRWPARCAQRRRPVLNSLAAGAIRRRFGARSASCRVARRGWPARAPSLPSGARRERPDAPPSRSALRTRSPSAGAQDAARRRRPLRRLRGDAHRLARRGARARRRLPRSQCRPARCRPARRVLPHRRQRPAGADRVERCRAAGPSFARLSLEVVLSLGRWLADVTVIDCGFSLEEDDELAYEAARSPAQRGHPGSAARRRPGGCRRQCRSGRHLAADP